MSKSYLDFITPITRLSFRRLREHIGISRMEWLLAVDGRTAHALRMELEKCPFQ